MANILSVNDSTFATGIGNWTGLRCTLTTSTTPPSPDGNKVLKLTKTASPDRSMEVRIPGGLYAASAGQYRGLVFDVYVPNTNSGTGPLEAFYQLVYYSTSGGGSSSGNVISAPFNPGDGWVHLTQDVTVPSAFPSIVSVGIEIRIRPVVHTSPFGFLTGDIAYLSDVELNDVPPVAAGGWAAGSVRVA